MRKQLLFVFLTAVLFSVSVQHVSAQNTSPYWSLAGNSNSNAASKLGTTIAEPLNLTTSNLTRIRIAIDGKVGIGTTNPQQRLHVEGSTNQAIFVNTTALGSTSGSGMIGSAKALPTAADQRLGYFLVGSRGGAENGYNGAGMVGYSDGAWSAGSSHPTYLAFETAPAGSAIRVERMRIGSNSNVGIGTSVLNYKLNVDGGSNVVAVYATTTGGYGVYANGASYGVYGSSNSGFGLYGYGSTGVNGVSNNSGYGVYGYSSSTYSDNGSSGVYGTGYYGVKASGTYGLYSTGSSTGVYATGNDYGVNTSGGSYGVYSSSQNIGVFGTSTNNYGVYGFSNNWRGVYGRSTGNIGGYFYSDNSNGMWAKTASTASGVYAGVFEGNVYSYGSYQTSDKKLKKNVTAFSDALAIISKLKPKNYEFIHEGKYASLALPKGTHYGFLAQDVEEVLPNLVDESVHDLNAPDTSTFQPGVAPAPRQKEETVSIKAVNYVELIPIMVKAMQEQEAENKDLKAEVDELKERITKLEALLVNGNTAVTKAALSQATPNPAGNTTRISYSLPVGTAHAQLLLTDATGKMLRSISLTNSGMVEVNTTGLSSGTYNYTLYVEGKQVETKRLVIAR